MHQGKLTRRGFFQGLAGLGAVAAVGRPSYAKASEGGPAYAEASAYAKASVGKSEGRPFFISTWKHGKPANEKAAEVFAAGGSLLDAIEKGINTAELDRRCCQWATGPARTKKA